MREERSRLRTQVYILEKERAAHEAQQQTNAARSQTPAVSLPNTSLERKGNRNLHLVCIELEQGNSAAASNTEPVSLQDGIDDKNEVTVREKRLQLKVQELTGALERITQSAEIRNQQSAELVNDVKKANGLET